MYQKRNYYFIYFMVACFLILLPKVNAFGQIYIHSGKFRNYHLFDTFDQKEELQLYNKIYHNNKVKTVNVFDEDNQKIIYQSKYDRNGYIISEEKYQYYNEVNDKISTSSEKSWYKYFYLSKDSVNALKTTILSKYDIKKNDTIHEYFTINYHKNKFLEKYLIINNDTSFFTFCECSSVEYPKKVECYGLYPYSFGIYNQVKKDSINNKINYDEKFSFYFEKDSSITSIQYESSNIIRYYGSNKMTKQEYFFDLARMVYSREERYEFNNTYKNTAIEVHSILFPKISNSSNDLFNIDDIADFRLIPQEYYMLLVEDQPYTTEIKGSFLRATVYRRKSKVKNGLIHESNYYYPKRYNEYWNDIIINKIDYWKLYPALWEITSQKTKYKYTFYR